MEILIYPSIFLLGTLPLYSQATDSMEVETRAVDVGGALRYNYNLSSWTENQRKREGDLGFEVFRIDVDAKYRNCQLGNRP